MYIKEGISYADDARSITGVTEIKALPDYRLLCTFTTGEIKVYDFKPLLDVPIYAPLQDVELFNSVEINYGVPEWTKNGLNLDISPDRLLIDGEPYNR